MANPVVTWRPKVKLVDVEGVHVVLMDVADANGGQIEQVAIGASRTSSRIAIANALSFTEALQSSIFRLKP